MEKHLQIALFSVIIRIVHFFSSEHFHPRGEASRGLDSTIFGLLYHLGVSPFKSLSMRACARMRMRVRTLALRYIERLVTPDVFVHLVLAFSAGLIFFSS